MKKLLLSDNFQSAFRIPLFTFRFSLFAFSLAALLLGSPAQAGNVTWSSVGNSTAGGDGNWTGGNTWWTGSAIQQWTTPGDNATFSAAGNTTLNADVTAGSLTFASGSENISVLAGAGNLTVNSGITATNSANTTALTDTISANLTLGANQTWTVNNGGTVGTANLAVSGVIGGSNLGITKAGNGTLTLSGTNTFSGGLTVNAGTLNINNNSAIGSGLLTLGTPSVGATFDNTSGGLISISNNISSLYNAIFTGTNALTTSGSYTYDNGNRILTVNGSGNLTVGSVVNSTSGNGNLRKSGSGTLSITGAGPSTAAVELYGGTLIVGNKASLGGSAYSFNLGAAGTLQSSADLTGTNKVPNAVGLGTYTLTLSGTNNFELGGIISGSGALTKSGANTVTLSGTNTYTDATSITSGTLTVTGVLGSGGGTAVTTSTSGTAFNVTNTNGLTGTSSLTVGTGTTANLLAANNFTGATGVTGTLNLQNAGSIGSSSVTLNNGSTLQLRNNTNNTSFLTSGAAVLLANTTESTTIDVNNLTAGTGNTLTLGSGLTYTSNAARTATVNVTGGNSYILSLPSVSVTNNASTNAIVTMLINPTSAGVTIGTFTATVPTSGAKNVYLTLDGTATNNVITGVISQVNTGSWLYLTKQGTGTWTLQGNNTSILGPTVVSAGILNLQNGNALGTAGNGASSVTSGATLQLQGGITLAKTFNTISGSGASGATGALESVSGNNTISSLVTLGAATTISSDTSGDTLTLSGNITGATFGLTVAGTGNTTVNSIIGTTTGNLTKTGLGTLTLSGANTYTGGTTISGGTLVADRSNNTGNPSNSALGNPQSAQNITVGNGGTLKFNQGDTLGSASSTPQATLVIQGGGTVTNNGNNFTTLGPVTLNGGTLTGTGGANASYQMYNFSNTVTASNSATSTISGSGGSAGYHLAANTTFQVDSGSTLNISGILVDRYNSGGSGGLTKIGAGNLTLSGNNSYTGATNINAGTLTFSGSGTTPAGNVINVNNTGMLNFGNNDTWGASATPTSAAITINTGGTVTSGGKFNTLWNLNLNGGTLSSNGGVNTNYGTFGLAGTVTAAAGVTSTISNGTGSNNFINLGNGSSTSSTIFTVGTGGTLNISTLLHDHVTSTSTTAATGLTMSGGSGTLTLSGANTYTGTTTIISGTLKNGSATTFTSKGALSLSSTGIFDLGGFNASVTNISASTAGNTITNNGSSDVTLTISAQANQISALIKDGSSKKLTVGIANANSGVVDSFAPGTTQNTFSGGLTLLNNGTGTRLRISSLITTTGSPGAITSSPFGTGPITIGQANMDKAMILIDTVGNNTLANDIIVNTALGTDAAGAIRVDTAGNTLSGTITANLANAKIIVSSAGGVTVTGNVTGSSGLEAGTSTYSGIVTLSGTNTYAGATTINAGTLEFAKMTSLYNGSTGSWTAANINVKSAATLALKVDSAGTAGFDSTSLNTLLTNISVAGNATAGLQSGANIAFDTNTATGGTFTQGNLIANSTGANGGAIGVTKLGTGTLVLDKANTYTGATTVSAGTLQLQNAASVSSSSALTMSSGTTLDLRADSNTMFSPASVNEAGSGTVTYNYNVDAITPGTTGKTLTLANVATQWGPASTTDTFNLTGGAGSGYTLAMGSGSSGTGGLQIWNNTTVNSNTAGVTLKIAGGIAVNYNSSYTLAFGGAGNITLGALTRNGSNNLTPTFGGSGTIQLDGANNFGAATGTISTTGTLKLNNAAALTGLSTLTISGAATIDNITGGTITLANPAQNWNSNFTFAGTQALNLGTGAVSMNASRQVTVNGTGSTGLLTVGGVISGTGFGLTKAGTGTLTLSGNNAYSGLTTINGGTLNINSEWALGGSNYGGLTFGVTGGTLQYATTLHDNTDITQTSLGVAKNVTLTGNATIDTNGNNITFANPVGNSGSGSLTKAGAGNLTLSGINTYNGTTTVSAGTLTVNGTLASASISVNGGSLLIGNTNSITSNATSVTMNGTLGIASGVSSSNQTFGALTLSGNSTLDFASGANNVMRFDSFNNSGTGILSITHWLTTTHLVFTTSVAQADWTRFSFGSGLQTSQIGYTGAGGGFEIIAVPEPGTVLAGFLLLGGLAIAERKRLARLLAAVRQGR